MAGRWLAASIESGQVGLVIDSFLLPIILYLLIAYLCRLISTYVQDMDGSGSECRVTGLCSLSSAHGRHILDNLPLD